MTEKIIENKNNEELEHMKKALVGLLYPKKIYLFGSFARGDQTEDSDYDLCVILDNNTPRTMEEYAKAYKAVRGRTRPVDIIIYNEMDFEEKKSKRSIEKKVEEEGVVLYER